VGFRGRRVWPPPIDPSSPLPPPRLADRPPVHPPAHRWGSRLVPAGARRRGAPPAGMRDAALLRAGTERAERLVPPSLRPGLAVPAHAPALAAVAKALAPPPPPPAPPPAATASATPPASSALAVTAAARPSTLTSPRPLPTTCSPSLFPPVPVRPATAPRGASSLLVSSTPRPGASAAALAASATRPKPKPRLAPSPAPDEAPPPPPAPAPAPSPMAAPYGAPIPPPPPSSTWQARPSPPGTRAVHECLETGLLVVSLSAGAADDAAALSLDGVGPTPASKAPRGGGRAGGRRPSPRPPSPDLAAWEMEWGPDPAGGRRSGPGGGGLSSGPSPVLRGTPSSSEEEEEE